MVEGSAFKNNYTSVLERAVHKKNKNTYTDLRKAANHPLLLLRLYEKNLDNIIQESHDLRLFGQNVSIRRVREYIHSAQTGNDFRLHQHCEDFQSGSM